MESGSSTVYQLREVNKPLGFYNKNSITGEQCHFCLRLRSLALQRLINLVALLIWGTQLERCSLMVRGVAEWNICLLGEVNLATTFE